MLPSKAYGIYVRGARGIVVNTEGKAFPELPMSRNAAQEYADWMNKTLGWPTVEDGRAFFDKNTPRIAGL